MDFQIKRLWVKKSKTDHQKWEKLLHQAGIQTEENVDYTVGLFDGEKLIGTGSIADNVLKCFAVCKDYTGGGAINQLVSHLMNKVFEDGETACYVYTKPASKAAFQHLGFKEISRVEEELVFMEKAAFGFESYLQALSQEAVEGERIAGIVMNANPFTKGHQYLVETAAKENDWVHLFVLSEDASVFPAADRKKLVKEGGKYLKNISIHDTKSYLVSSATFPSYFLKENSDVTRIQAKLDATIFREAIAPTLNIRFRYVGEEPYSEATNIYNEAMAEVFDDTIQLIILPRKATSEEVISASRVRTLFAENKLNELKALVPQTTFDYLNSQKGKEVQLKLKNKE
ncbi:[citrate (pro-3S)-lyase] ligase [Carnobacterium mobile]|uniref:[citrate (pro-3S)-lyase] ligase n=1 Tax=Carnobacterium mobile TaxID=2750 RepID=UPI000551E09D|nr:[citrate (pro-3S)-lyase] ligase [Carnobacterium mobile]